MSETKKFLLYIILFSLGWWVYHCDFLFCLKAAKPSLPWWDMSTWFYHSTVLFYQLGSIIIMVWAVLGMVVFSLRQFKSLFTNMKNNFE
ncbi:MAG: hypothetical protein QXR60_02390 [Candidatus Nanoarchaeia archaeon]